MFVNTTTVIINQLIDYSIDVHFKFDYCYIRVPANLLITGGNPMGSKFRTSRIPEI